MSTHSLSEPLRLVGAKGVVGVEGTVERARILGSRRVVEGMQ